MSVWGLVSAVSWNTAEFWSTTQAVLVLLKTFFLIPLGCREHSVSGCWHSSGRDYGRYPSECWFSALGVLHPGVPVMWYAHIRDLSPTAKAVRGAERPRKQGYLGVKQMWWSLTCVRWCSAVRVEAGRRRGGGLKTASSLRTHRKDSVGKWSACVTVGVSVVCVPVLLSYLRFRSSSFSASLVFAPPSWFFWPAVAFLFLWMSFLSWMASRLVFSPFLGLCCPFFPFAVLHRFCRSVASFGVSSVRRSRSLLSELTSDSFVHAERSSNSYPSCSRTLPS